MSNDDCELKMISVMEPSLCSTCPNANIAEVLFTDGSTRRMFYCSRLDCDNWTLSAQPDELPRAA